MLNFHGPFHFNDIHQQETLFVKKARRGIYIWGFCYKRDTGELNGLGELVYGAEQFNIKTMKFVPHYVGKHETNVFNRLWKHHDVLHGNGLKYKRLSLDYMRAFFPDPAFPINQPPIEAVINFIVAHHGQPIEYWNNNAVLNQIYGGAIQLNGHVGHWPINEQLLLPNLQHLPDSLDTTINTHQNFWFCYFTENGPVDDMPLNYLEAYTFWSLKGKTIGKADFGTLDGNPLIYFGDEVQFLFKGQPADDWPGYE